ncbi:MAG TPA: hypothetical protein VNK43_04265, partial [Gemmatimonadales bacterium]|nr:hypothetical protein [Gemmatimonadales bacterium]
QPALEGDSSLADRARTLRWVDSLIGAALVSRAPDVKWVLPPELRRIARRAPTLADPDHLGQSVMRAPGLRQLPEPLHSNLRGLVALAGGRYAFIPAALGLSRDGAGIVKAELAVVMADARRGDVPWRTVASGTGPTPREAVRAALASMLPLGSGAP